MNLPSTKFSVRAEIEDRLQRLAEESQQPTDALIHEAIEQYVDREERRAQLRRDAVTAWDEYQSTGQHVTADEADAWLSLLEAGDDAEPPLSHG